MQGKLAAVLTVAIALVSSDVFSGPIQEIDDNMKRIGERATKIMGRRVVGVTADRLIRAYKSNEIQADGAVKNELVFVGGILNKVQRSLGGKPQAIIDPLNDDLWPGCVICNFEDGFEEVVGKLEAGSFVMVMGLCDGASILDSVTVNGCGPYAKRYQELLAKEEEKQEARDKELAQKAEAEKAEQLKQLAEENRKKRPAVAAGQLKLAKSLKAAGKGDGYRKWLKRVADQYPETEAAKEARTLLEDE